MNLDLTIAVRQPPMRCLAVVGNWPCFARTLPHALLVHTLP